MSKNQKFFHPCLLHSLDGLCVLETSLGSEEARVSVFLEQLRTVAPTSSITHTVVLVFQDSCIFTCMYVCQVDSLRIDIVRMSADLGHLEKLCDHYVSIAHTH
jgi:hypothetical protein